MLAAVSAVFGQHGVQLVYGPAEREGKWPRRVVGHTRSPLGALQDALIGIASLDVVSEVASFLRVWR